MDTGWTESWVTAGTAAATTVHVGKKMQRLTTVCNVVRRSNCDGVRSTRLPASASTVSTRTQHDYLTPGQRVNIAFIAPTSYNISDYITSRRAIAMPYRSTSRSCTLRPFCYNAQDVVRAPEEDSVRLGRRQS